MGAGGSKKKKEEDDMSLVKRAERRFESYGYPVMDTGSTDVVQTADKYDFLLVFRDPEDAGPKEKGAGSGGGGAEEGDEEGGLEAIFSPLLSAITPTSLGVFSDETLNGAYEQKSWLLGYFKGSTAFAVARPCTFACEKNVGLSSENKKRAAFIFLYKQTRSK